jgi:hypothetical protein
MYNLACGINGKKSFLQTIFHCSLAGNASRKNVVAGTCGFFAGSLISNLIY